MSDSSVLYAFLGLLAFLAYYVWMAASLSAVFAKAGEEGWKAWVPILNMIVLLRLAALSPWLVLLFLVPLAGLVVLILATYRVGVSFGYGVGMTVVAVLLFPLWSSIIGWGSARWVGAGHDASGPMRRGDGWDPRTAPAPASAPLPPRPPVPATPATPPTRSSVRAAAAAAAEADAAALSGHSHAPFTQTVPTTSAPAAAGPAPAEPRRAFAPAEPDPAAPFAAADQEASPPAIPAPVHEIPAPPPPPPVVDPWAPVPPRPTRYSPADAAESHFDTSAEVSAVVGAPTLGAPRSARESVAAQHAIPQLPDAESAFDETIITARNRAEWMLTPPLGAALPVTSDVVIIGRRPGFDPDFPDAQLVPVSDETRTMSKTHARLERQGESWMIVDLDSTNGVILVGDEGAEVDATPGVPERLTERFLLGDAELRLTRGEPG